MSQDNTSDSQSKSSDHVASDRSQIKKFISSVSNKNYADAHKYLGNAVEDKMLTRINSATDKPLF